MAHPVDFSHIDSCLSCQLRGFNNETEQVKLELHRISEFALNQPPTSTGTRQRDWSYAIHYYDAERSESVVVSVNVGRVADRVYEAIE